MWRRRNFCGVVASAMVVGCLLTGVARHATAAIPISTHPTLLPVRKLRTNPFAGAMTTRVDDAEGLAFDPVRNTLWLSDDTRAQLVEIDYASGALLTVLSAAEFATVPPFVAGGPAAGPNRIGDNEGLAYDPHDDTMYLLSGPCCVARPHLPTAFRFRRRAPGGPLLPESYQSIVDPVHDFSGAAILDGELYVSGTRELYTYDYEDNVVSPPVARLPFLTSSVTGLGFSSDGRDLWMTTTGDDLYRLAVPGFTVVPNYAWLSLKPWGIRDGRAVEVVGDQLVIADGYDGFSLGSPDRHAIYVLEFASDGAPVASFTTSPATGAMPLTVTFTDVSTPRPTNWVWDFGDGSPRSIEANPTHVYTKVGAFTVRLIVTNGDGSSSTTRAVEVRSATPPPVTTSVPPPSPPPPQPPPQPGASTFIGVNPARLMDTRHAPTVDHQFEGAGSLGAGQHQKLHVVGRGGVPSTGVGSVALNVTAVDATDTTYLTVWPAGVTQPTASNLNVARGQTVANMVVVTVGADGDIELYNDAGTADVLVDVLGWFPLGGSYTGLTPARVVDTRPSSTIDGRDAGEGALTAGAVHTAHIGGRGGVPMQAGAVVLNVTAIGATADSYLTVWPGGIDRPVASNLNVAANTTIANLVVVPLGVDGTVQIYDDSGRVDVAVDVLGWFAAGADFHPLTGVRVVDSRDAATVDGLFRNFGGIGPGRVAELKVVGRGAVPATGVRAVVANVTAVGATATSYLTVWPSDQRQPVASHLNLAVGRTVANLIIVPVGPDGAVKIYNDSGSVDVIVDVLGWIG